MIKILIVQKTGELLLRSDWLTRTIIVNGNGECFTYISASKKYGKLEFIDYL